VLQREFVAGWRAVSIAAKRLKDDSTAAGRKILRPLAKLGPIRLLKLLKLSLLETHGLRPKQKELTRLILALDKITKLIFSYAWRPLKSAGASISSSEKVILERVAENADHFAREFADGFVPSSVMPVSSEERDENYLSPKLIEAERTIDDLVPAPEEVHQTTSAPREKKSLFVADAFTNPTHVQFALKVTLAGMIGYIFYTASDYFGIHTVYYTPLIIALGSTGATMHKGLLRIVGCVIGGALGLISTIWLIPRFETLGMYLFIVFCLHGLAAWIAFGSERISYMGLQIALTFDLGVLKDYGPAKGIDPIRDRFIGIILGILIIATVFSLVWPEDARSAVRQKLVACLRAVTRLLNIRGGRESNLQRERLELEIASRLAEANAFQEQAAFEALIHGPAASKGLDLENVVAAVEEVYVASLPWIREQAATAPAADRETASRAPEMVKPIVDAVEASAALIESSSGRNIAQGELPVDERERVSQSDAGRSSERFEELVGAVKELHVAVSGPLGARS
jgi:hypothetical protein